jgi:hypothetical protein
VGPGDVLGGRLGNLSSIRFRFGWAGLVGVALQFSPLGGTPGYLLLAASFLLLIFVASANWQLAGFVLVLVGLWMNFLVIVVNDGMPITREAIVASGQSDTLADLTTGGGGSKHHLATDEDRLLFLADRIAIPPPVRQAVSVGDVVAYAGAMWFVIEGMRRREAPTGFELVRAEA